MEVIIEIYDYIIKRSGVLSNILKHTINDLDIIAVLYRDFVLENKLDYLQ